MALKVRHAREVKEDSAEDVAALTHAMHEHRAAREDAETKLAHERQVGRLAELCGCCIVILKHICSLLRARPLQTGALNVGKHKEF